MPNSNREKVVLAYSGGLDTSIIIPWLKENYSYDVIAMVGDVGQGDDIDAVVEKAYKTGASKVVVEDMREEFLTGYVFPSLRAGAVYEHKYLLGTSMARPVIAKHQVEVALREGATAVSHGCTGKGNDQVRFELATKALAPDLQIIAPWREWKIASREEAIAYARAHNVPVEQTTKNIYSRDRNIWHLSHEGGVLEDPANAPDENMWQWVVSPAAAPEKPTTVEIGFEAGTPVSVNGKKLDATALLTLLNEIAAANAVGRMDIVENRLVGIKSRGAYETPGGTLLVTAHRELESLALDRETAHYQQILSLRYAEMVYYGMWFTPLREALDAFFVSSQRRVTGSISLTLCRGNVSVASRQSPYSLYRTNLASFTMTGYNPKDAEGFINLFALPITVPQEETPAKAQAALHEAKSR
jgi:argininosuccinate synthase